MSLLLVEDNDRLAEALVMGLTEDGLPTTRVAGFRAAQARLGAQAFDAIVLDLGLPDGDGTALIAELRAQGRRVPILVVTARDTVEERIRALDLGADDFLVKPFVYAELLARLRALLRRAAAPAWAPLSAGDVRLDLERGRLVCADGAQITLTPRERAVLGVLMRRQGAPVPRAEILSEAFGYHFDPGTNVVDVHVAHLRQKLTGRQVRIEAVRGVGYQLCVLDPA
ncbi:MAG: response regulator transcription factor [Alphaproteobacteria bacterium]|nr:response regulator transcription factor [Alphaproteobacteria bacterium]